MDWITDLHHQRAEQGPPGNIGTVARPAEAHTGKRPRPDWMRTIREHGSLGGNSTASRPTSAIIRTCFWLDDTLTRCMSTPTAEAIIEQDTPAHAPDCPHTNCPWQCRHFISECRQLQD